MKFYFAYPIFKTLHHVRGTFVFKLSNIVCFLLVLNTQLLPGQGITDSPKPVRFQYLHDVTAVIYSQLGDVNIGDIVEIYPWNSMTQCKTYTHVGRIADLTESTKYAVDWVNKHTDLLPNVSLGFVIHGTCASLPSTLANSLSFLPRTERICNGSDCYTKRMMSSSEGEYMTHDVIGMLAPQMSTLASVLSSLFAMARVPLLGYAAGGFELSNSWYHPYFFRVNTGDNYQVRAILKFISDNGWSYIQYIYKDDFYGRDARKFLTDYAGEYGICIAESHMLTTKASYMAISKALLRKPFARVVVFFLAAFRFETFLTHIHQLNGTGHFIWIGGDQFESYRGFQYKEMTMTIDPGVGAFTVFPYSNLVTEFYDYVKNIDVFKTNNPWLKDEWENVMGCSYAKNTCPKTRKNLLINPRKESSLKMDAILAFAHAAHNLIQDRCPGAQGRDARACITGELLKEYLQKVKFVSFNGPVEFNINHEVIGKFSIRQLKFGYKGNQFFPNTSKRIYDTDIAIYDSNSDSITYLDQPISWSHLNMVERLVPLSNASLAKDVPESVCSRPCVVGEYKIEKDLPCCWDCLRCRENERLINENTGCEACPIFQWPDPWSDFTTCVDIQLTYQTTKDPIPIALVSVAVFVMTLTLFVYSAYVKYRNERVIKASSKELSFIQLVGISGGYITVILFQTTPTDVMCTCIFFLFCMSFCMLYSPLLVKTVRIFRIFRSASENKKPRFINPQSQLIISIMLITIQLLLCGVIYFLYVPEARRTQPIWSEKMVELSCDFTIPGLASFLGYNILLVSLCSVFAFMVRKLPDNYNESRFISMCVSTTLLIWMAFVPTYFTADREYMRMFLLCMALLLNHSVALLLLFFPRIYAAMFMSDESLNFAMKK